MSAREHPVGECQYCDAFEAFDAWVAKHDPNGNMTLTEQANAYADWYRRLGEEAKQSLKGV